MALSTLSIDTLLKRNERAFERAKLQPDMNIDTLRARQRRRLQKLLSDRSDINDLANTEDQKIRYGGEEGMERWQKDFILLKDLKTVPNIKFEGEKLRHHLWRQIPNSRFKRFQELFSRPEDFCVPRFTTDAAGRVRFGDIDFNTESLLGCLVSADRIPEQLAEDLRLCDFSGDKGDPIARLKKKREQIPALKKIWEATVPLQEGHHRLLRIETPSKEIEAQYASIIGPDPRILGTLLYTRERENGAPLQSRREPTTPRALSVQHFTSVYAAHRKTEHEHQLYQRELEMLSNLREDLRTLNGTLDREWKKGTPDTRKGELRAEAMALFSRVNVELQACENRHKVRAHDVLLGSETLTDKSGKSNVTAAMTKMIGAIDALKRRLREIYPKGGFNHQDQMVLRTEIGAQERHLKDFRTGFSSGAPHLSDHLAIFDANTRMSDTQLEGNVRGIEMRLGNPTVLRRVTLAPLRGYGCRMEKEWSTLHATLHARNRDGAINQAIKIHVIGKLQAACTCFEHLKGFTSNALRIPLSQIRDFIKALHTLLEKRELFPDRSIELYVAPFETIVQKVETLARELKKYEGKDLDIGERTMLYRSLRESIDTLDMQAMLSELHSSS